MSKDSMLHTREFAGGINGIPQFADRKAMWDSLSIQQINNHSPAIDEFVKHLNDCYVNGVVSYGCFELGGSDVLDWYCSRNRLQEMFFFKNIWAVETIQSHFGIKHVEDDADTRIQWSSPFLLGGTLAWNLDIGGAYKKPSWGGAKTKAIGEKAALEMINNDFHTSLVFDSNEAWCDFFYDVAWDRTSAVLNKQTRQLHVLLATDTD